ncbi:MAG: hypothetical protein OXU26_04355 [Acidobacteriota bacterium]|nr:hypothetical protein [Acidobacteriota bacterium]
MRIASLCLVVLLVLAGSSFGFWRHPDKPTQQEIDHINWLGDRMKEAMSIRVGMSLEELLRVFEPDGGLQTTSLMERIQPSGDADDETLSHRTDEGRFVLRTCPLLKVRVHFEIPAGINPIEASRKDVKITKLSKVYLEPPHVD